MPRIRHWFPVSHDINSDPEVWELTDNFGLWGFRMWLQILSIADRNDGVVKGSPDALARMFVNLCESNSRKLGAEWRRNRSKTTLEWMQNKGWIRAEQGAYYVVKYTDYHITRDAKRNGTASPPIRSVPNPPSDPKEDKEIQVYPNTMVDTSSAQSQADQLNGRQSHLPKDQADYDEQVKEAMRQANMIPTDRKPDK